ncbi:MAG: toll/interleukin-1 receptor domain-containing protein [Micromonosporaceae bacterium]
MSDQEGKHVFVSYVREDSDAVDELCAVLEAAQIPYWRDRKDLGPGDAWKAKIRSAIRDGSLVFLACFSDNSRAKKKSYMNEELTLAARSSDRCRLVAFGWFLCDLTRGTSPTGILVRGVC